MNSAALVVAAGLPKYDSTPSAMFTVGSVSSAQRVVSSIQKAGVTAVYLVVDKSTSKLEKQLNLSGVFFIRAEGRAPDCLKQAIKLMPQHYDSILICPADRPLVLPKTLIKLLSAGSDFAVLASKRKESPFFLLKAAAVRALCNEPSSLSIPAVLEQLGYDKELIESDDVGVFCTARKAALDKPALKSHQDTLTRPVMEISLLRDNTILDWRLMRILALVKELGSVRNASEMCGLSYSTAWNLLNFAEEALGYPLIRRNQGGRSGSGSALTDKGCKILEAYTSFEKAMNEKMQSLFNEHLKDII